MLSNFDISRKQINLVEFESSTLMSREFVLMPKSVRSDYLQYYIKRILFSNGPDIINRNSLEDIKLPLCIDFFSVKQFLFSR